jgi:hypothetical protein
MGKISDLWLSIFHPSWEKYQTFMGKISDLWHSIFLSSWEKDGKLILGRKIPGVFKNEDVHA